MKHLHLFIIVLISLSLLGGCGWLGGSDNGGFGGKRAAAQENFGVNKPQKPSFKIPVTVEKVERGRMYSYLQAVGTVVPVKDVEIQAEKAGRIFFAQKWMEGDQVQQGKLLATIEDRQLRLDLEEAKSELQLAKAAVGPAKAELDQAKKQEEFNKAMYERGAVSKAEWDNSILTRIQREHALKEAKQTVEVRRMAVERLEDELEKTRCAVPWDGVLLPPEETSTSTNANNYTPTDLTLKHGQLVSAGEVVCRIANINQVYVALDMPAKDVTQVEIGQDVMLDVYSRYGTKFTGKVADISTSLNATTRTYTVNVLVDNKNHELRPGMFAKAQIITEERPDAISIPRSIVQLRNNRHVVFVVKEKKETPQSTRGNPEGEEGRIARGGVASNRPNTDSSNQGGGKSAYAGEARGSRDEGASSSVEVDTPEEPQAASTGPEAEGDNPFADKTWVAEERVVELGIQNRENVEIVDGLREGEYLVVLGYETLTDGVEVNVSLSEENLLSVTPKSE